MQAQDIKLKFIYTKKIIFAYILFFLISFVLIFHLYKPLKHILPFYIIWLGFSIFVLIRVSDFLSFLYIKSMYKRITSIIEKDLAKKDTSHSSLSIQGLLQHQELILRDAERLLKKDYHNLNNITNRTISSYLKLKEGYLSILKTLVSILDIRDYSNRGHAERVAFMAKYIATQLKLDDKSVLDIEYAAILHDIGKVALPDKLISLDFFKMSAEDIEVYREHPITGAKIVRKISFLSNIADIIATHHEKMDGSGYPLGLKEKDIPIEARIIGICEVFDKLYQKHKMSSVEILLKKLQQLNKEKYYKSALDLLISMLMTDNQILNELYALEGREKTFFYYNPNATEVILVGEFNFWTIDKNVMHKDRNGIWRTIIKAKPGNYLYYYIVDGVRTHDPIGESHDGYSIIKIN